MPAVYVHLSGKNIDDAALRAAGIEIEENKQERHKMKPKNCPRCHQVVGATFNLCPYCGYSLTIEQAMSEDEMEMEADDEVVKLLASDPRLMEVLKRALKKL